MEAFDKETGEITEQIAADGGQRYPAAHSLADFMKMQEDGQFDADVAFDLNELAAEMEQVAAETGQGKLKAKLTVTVDITRDPAGFYIFAAKHVIKRPDVKRKQSIGWVTEENKFTPNKPRQGHLFGTIRDVTPRREVRN